MFCFYNKFNIHLIIFFSYLYHAHSSSDLYLGEVVKLSRANNDFAMHMFGILSTFHGNQVFSPISLFSAFSLLYFGANGKTRADIHEFLKMSEDFDDNGIKESFKYLYNNLIAKPNKSEKIQLNMFNTVLSHSSLELKVAFETIARNCFKADVFIDNFQVSRALVDSINKMIRIQTNGKIEKLIESSLDPQTMFMIFNVIYFQGLWQKEFNSKDTRDHIFTNSKNEKEKVKMMSLINQRLNYIKESGILDSQILELPYKDPRFSLLVFLPRTKNGLTRLKLNLNAHHINTLLKQMHLTKLNVILPKFKFSDNYSIKQLLEEKLGRQLFYTGADLSRMTDQKNIVINDIWHKVVIEVNERGTKASAVTAIGMETRSMENSDVVYFKADHPFLYMVYERRTNMILFMGQVTHLTDYEEDIKHSFEESNQDNNESDDEHFEEIYDKMRKKMYGFDFK